MVYVSTNIRRQYNDLDNRRRSARPGRAARGAQAMTTDEIKQLIAQYATDCGIDPGVAIAQAQRESGFRQDVIFGPTESSDGLGCRGLMQFCSGAWSQYGVGDFSNAFDIYSNLDAWCAYMQSLLARYSGDIS